MLLRALFLFVLAVRLNEVGGIKPEPSAAYENKACSRICQESSAALHAQIIIDRLNTRINQRKDEEADIGGLFSKGFEYVVSGQTKMNKEEFVKYLSELPKEQFVFIKCNDVKHTIDSISCNSTIYGPNYGNVSTVRISFDPVLKQILGFHEK
ncbi:hypothetical protein CAEBREN_19462 [Caenorhabditis brenneri]|uniref:NTF2-like domain-containing protein n=1 Tax=Caenorhabditis brenneri TaxID=135651 RepID=G0P783_CAEBE|nr:hypothetical protein CAEBREN_19462 [Caenorhabditis brenneri]